MKKSPSTVYDIMLVEDNVGDVLLVREALLEIDLPHRLHVANNGKKAIDMVIEEKLNPHLILLDINLPLKSGFEVLEIIKKTEHSMHIPVVMLTTSSSPSDIKKSYGLHASSYLCKPNDLDELIELMRRLSVYYFKTSKMLYQ